MLHAIENSIVVEDIGEDPDRWLVIGPEAMTKRIYGRTKTGTPITDDLIEQLADEAEGGYDVDEIIARRGKRGRPRLGTQPSTVESVRLDPELKERLARRAEEDGVPVSEVIRDALRSHLEAS